MLLRPEWLSQPAREIFVLAALQQHALARWRKPVLTSHS